MENRHIIARNPTVNGHSTYRQQPSSDEMFAVHYPEQQQVEYAKMCTETRKKCSEFVGTIDSLKWTNITKWWKKTNDCALKCWNLMGALRQPSNYISTN